MSADAHDLVGRLRQDGMVRLRLSDAAWRPLERAISAAFDFFRQPLEQKLAATLPDECGYRPIGAEYSQEPSRPDQIESFTVSGRMLSKRSGRGRESSSMLDDHLLTVFEQLESIAEALTIEIAASSAERPPDEELRGALRNWSRLQLNYSRPAEARADLIHDMHEDGSFLTLAGATVPGLEVQMRSDEIAPFTTLPGELLVLPGEIASLLTGGTIMPLYHRVVPDRQYDERIAYLFFADIDPRRCQPWVTNASNEGVDIGSVVRTSVRRFGLQGFSTED